MDVFLKIRRKKLTIFTPAQESTTVLELKKIIEGITKIPPANQLLRNKDDTVMDDARQLQDYGLNGATAKAESPATVGLAIRDDNGKFEDFELSPYSTPLDLPDLMRPQENNGPEPTSSN